jgi:hypothetical protein
MCNCIVDTDEAFDRTPGLSHQKLDSRIVVDPKTGRIRAMLCVGVVKKDNRSKKKIMPLFATYCPFCGEKYEKDV